MTNPMEDFVKGGMESVEKTITDLKGKVGITDKDQSGIKAQLDSITKIFDEHKSPEKLLAALDDQVAKYGSDPKKLVGHTIAMRDFMAKKTEDHKFHASKVGEDLTIKQA